MNGGFDFWQRNTTFTSFEGKICDRFAIGYATSPGRATWSREASIIPPNGLTPYSMKAQTSIIDAAPAAGALGLLRHRVEGNYFRALKGKTFFLKGKIYTNVTGNWTIGFANSGEGNRWLDQISVPVANTWTDFILDVTHNPAIGTWLYDAGVGLVIAVPTVAGTSHQTSAANKRNWNTSTGWVITGSANQNFHSSLSNVLYLAQLQLVTDPDEPFQRFGGSVNEELRLCQRYYTLSIPQGPVVSATGGQGYVGKATVSTEVWGQTMFPVPMRTAPSVIPYDNSGNANRIHRVNIGDHPNAATASIVDSNGFTRIDSTGLTTANPTNVYVCGWTADADY
jgi:hypothetical protein